MSVYNFTASAAENSLVQSEIPLYGSSRLGVFNINRVLWQPINIELPIETGIKNPIRNHIQIGTKVYELSNHLGNVLVTISDKKKAIDANSDGVIDYYEAIVVSANDYYPFGMTMPERNFSSNSYRYGFNGKENDKDISEGDLDFGARIMDTRIGRFLSIDPLMRKFPNISNYSYAGNSPIVNIDLEGKENVIYLVGFDAMTGDALIKVQNQINAYYETLGLKTRAMIYTGKDFSKDYVNMDPHDAVAYIGNEKSVTKAISKVDQKFAEGLEKSLDFGVDRDGGMSNGGKVNPEISGNQYSPNAAFENNRIIAVNMEDAKLQAGEDILNTTLTKGIAFDVVHGSGHNSGLGHEGSLIGFTWDPKLKDNIGKYVSPSSLMADGSVIKATIQNSKNTSKNSSTNLITIDDFVRSKDNKDLLPKMKERFGEQEAKTAKNISAEIKPLKEKKTKQK